MDLKDIAVLVLVLIGLFFVLFSKTIIPINGNEFEFKGFLYDWVYCDIYHKCYNIQAYSEINTTVYLPPMNCTSDGTLDCCTIDNETVCTLHEGGEE